MIRKRHCTPFVCHTFLYLDNPTRPCCQPAKISTFLNRLNKTKEDNVKGKGLPITRRVVTEGEHRYSSTHS